MYKKQNMSTAGYVVGPLLKFGAVLAQRPEQ